MKIDFVIKPKVALIYDYMKEHNLNQKQIADIAGISQNALSQILNFRYIVKDINNSTYLIKICNIIGCTPEDLYPPELTNEIRKKLGKPVVISRQIEFTALPYNELLALESGDDPTEYTEKEELKNQLRKIIGTTLSPKEEKIIRMRFGIGEPDKTLDQVAKDFQLTRTRISQIEIKSLKKLRKKMFHMNIRKGDL